MPFKTHSCFYSGLPNILSIVNWKNKSILELKSSFNVLSFTGSSSTFYGSSLVIIAISIKKIPLSSYNLQFIIIYIHSIYLEKIIFQALQLFISHHYDTNTSDS